MEAYILILLILNFRLLPVAHSSEKPNQIKPSMTCIQSNGSKDIDVIFKANRSTEGCSKLKRSVDMTSSGMNGLNIRTNASMAAVSMTTCKV